MVELAERLMNIQRKIDQVLRIKTQLESRINQYLGMLGNSGNAEQLLSNLTSLANTFKRKKQVMDIVKGGVKEALKTLAEAEVIVLKTQGFKRRLLDNTLSQIPIVNKKFGLNRQPLIPLLNLMYSHLKRQFIYFEKNMDDIESVVKGQYTVALDLIIEVKKGEILEGIYETSYYKEIVALHDEEVEIIKGLGKESKAFRGKMAKVMNKVQIRLSQSDMFERHKNLAWLQVKFQMTPMATVGGGVALAIAPPLAPAVWLTLTFVNYAPLLTILAMEGTIRLKGPLKRAKELAALKLRVAKLKIPVPKTFFNELPVPRFNQPQRQPAYARA